MVFVPATLEDKIEAKGVKSDQYFKEYKNHEYWSNFVDKHLDLIGDLIERVKDGFVSLQSHQSTEINALDELKSFLEGNTTYSTWRNDRTYGERTLDSVNHRGAFVREAILPILSMSEGQYEVFFSWDSCKVDYFAQEPDFLSEKLRQNASNYRLHANPNFIEQIIEFVNTGVSNF